MQQGILVFGANGCGKSTAGRKLAEKLGMGFLDAEDYAFVDSAVPFAKARPREEYTALVQQEILKGDDFVLAAVKGDFGAQAISRYTCAFYLETDCATRMMRVRKRSFDRFGSRVLRGGDLYESEERFFQFAQNRSIEQITRWAEDNLKCPVVQIDTALPVDTVVRLMMEHFRRLAQNEWTGWFYHYIEEWIWIV